MHITILGAGNVGGALGKGWARKGHSIRYGVTSPSDVRHRAAAQAAGDAEVAMVAQAIVGADAIVLAVPWEALPSALAACGDLAGRTVIDATNPLRMGAGGLELALGFDTSGGETVAALAKGALVFKTMNQVGFEVMAEADGYAVPPVMYVAGDDAGTKPGVMGLVVDLGFHAVDAGPLRQSRLLEPLAMLWIHQALVMGAPRDGVLAHIRKTPGPVA